MAVDSFTGKLAVVTGGGSAIGRELARQLDGLDLGGNVAHQARHTLATKLLAAGASLAHIRKYLGHVSDRMAEHYAKVSHSDLDDLLSAVWVAGPGSASPGELLSGSAAPISRQEAMTLALDLSRRSTPAEGGFCTWQPVVDGGACPWNLDCQLRQVRLVRSRPALLAAQAGAMAVARRASPH